MAKKINQLSGMPQMSVAFSGWKSTISLVKIVNNIVDGFNTPTETTVTFKGVIQPLSAENLELKPEAQRGFEWLQIHVEIDDNTNFIQLNIGDNILYDGRKYRINGLKDYKLNNYVEYHAMEITQNG